MQSKQIPQPQANKEEMFEEEHHQKETKAPDAVAEITMTNAPKTQLLLGKQVETFILNANADLTFENLRHLRCTMMAPKIYRKGEWIKGKSGQIGSVQYQEFMDRSRSYEIKIVGINESNKTLVLETSDYREPYSHACHCPYPHHKVGSEEQHAHEHAHEQARVRLVKLRVQPLTNNIIEDNGDGEGESERCIVTWTHKISCDANDPIKHLQGIEAYKKAVIKEMQEGCKELMTQRQQERSQHQAERAQKEGEKIEEVQQEQEQEQEAK